MGVLATDIAYCTVMFCSLSTGDSKEEEAKEAMLTRPQEDDASEFKDLDSLCRQFDELVNQSVLYKYQHVGPWYIIMCPHAAEPFKDHDTYTPSATNTAPPPHTSGKIDASLPPHTQKSYAWEMASLARKMVVLANRNGHGLKMGIHTGSAAGAVLGKLRYLSIYLSTNVEMSVCLYVCLSVCMSE